MTSRLMLRASRRRPGRRVVCLAAGPCDAAARAGLPTSAPRRSGSGQGALREVLRPVPRREGGRQGYATAAPVPRPRDFTTRQVQDPDDAQRRAAHRRGPRNIIRRGMPYTSMPAWPHFTDQEVSELAYYLKTFSPDFANPERAAEPIELPSAPGRHAESIENGKELYAEIGCASATATSGAATDLGADAQRRLGPPDPPRRPHAALDLPRRPDARGHLPHVHHRPERHADAVVRRSALDEQRWALTDYIVSLSAQQRARLRQPRRRQALPATDRSGEGRGALRSRPAPASRSSARSWSRAAPSIRPRPR